MSGGTDPNVPNPYYTQTEQNESTPWLSGATPVDVDLSGLQEYAKQMANAREDLMTRQSHLSHLSSMPMEAWTGQTLGEAAFTRSQMMANASELSHYVGVLGMSLFNLGCAAQTIADIFNSTDGLSAASLNDVLFAFGDPKAGRPSGLPKNLGQTYNDAVIAATMSPTLPADSPLWSEPERTSSNPYETVMTSTMPDGQRREIVTTTMPYGYGPTVVTTNTYDAKGKLVGSTSTRTSYHYDSASGTSTETVAAYTGKTLNGQTVTATTYGGDGKVDVKTVTNTDGKGNPTGASSLTVDELGQQTEVTTSTRDGETHETDRVVVGAATEGPEGYPEPISTKYDRPSLGL